MSTQKFKAIFKGSFWLALASIVQRLSGIIVISILSRLLGASGLGTYALLQNTIQTGDNFSRLGVDAALHRNGSQYETIGKEAVGRLFGVGACLIISVASLLALALWLVSSSIATNFLGEPRIGEWLPLSGLIVLLTASADLPRLYLVALHAFRLYSLRDSVTSTVGATITITFAILFGLSGAIYGLLITVLIRFFWGGWLAHTLLKEKQISLRIDNFFQEAINILRFGLPFYFSNFLSNFVSLPLLGWLTRLGGVEQVGYIRVAQSLAQLISFIPTTVAPVIISYLSASFASDHQEYNKLKSIHLRSLWSLILVVSVAICFSLEFIVPALFGASYSEAILLSKITIWNAAMQTISGMFGQYMISAGQTRAIAIWNTGGLFIRIMSSFLMIPAYKAMGLLLAQSCEILFILLGYAKSGLSSLESSDKKIVHQLAFASFISLVISLVLPILLNSKTILLIALEFFVLLILFAWIARFSFKSTEKKILVKLTSSFVSAFIKIVLSFTKKV